MSKILPILVLFFAVFAVAGSQEYNRGRNTSDLHVATPPSAPTGLAATAGDRKVDLTWNPNPEFDILGYRIYRESGFLPALGLIDSVSAGKTTYTDTRVTNGVTYVYRVTAVNTAFEESDFSDPAEATPTGFAPSTTILSPNGGEVWRVGTTRAILWASDPVSAGDVTVDIEYSVDSGASWILIVAGTDDDGEEEWIIPDTPTSEALVRVSSLAAGTDVADVSDDPFTITRFLPPPEDFFDLAWFGGLLMVWTRVDDPEILGYTLHRSVNPNFIPNQFSQLAILFHPDTLYFDPYGQLTSLVSYTYVVAGFDSSSNLGEFNGLETTPVFLFDARGYLYDMDTYGGAFIWGSNHSYDRFYDMHLDDFAFDFFDSDDIVEAEDGGREYIFVNDDLKGLRVTRKIHVPRFASYARILDIYHNPTNSDINFSIRQDGNHGANFNFHIVTTSDGDQIVEPSSDLFIVTAGDSTQGDLALSHIFNGMNANHQIDNIDIFFDEMSFIWENITVAPGDSIAYLYFEVQDSSQIRAALTAVAIVNDPAKFTQGMSPSELRIVQNFALTGVAGPKIQLSRSGIGYGSLGIGRVADSVLVIFNSGSETLNITNQTITGTNVDEFSIAGGGGSVSLGPGDEHTVVIRFEPQTPGEKEAFYSVVSNDPTAPPDVSVTLTGTGVDNSGPPAPIGIQSSIGTNWTAVNSFMVSWTNPSDPSGIAAAHYKIGAEPTGPYDTTATVSVANVNTISVSIPEPVVGVHDIFVWLRDGLGNVADPTKANNHAQTALRYDNAPPLFESHTPPSTGTFLQSMTIVANTTDSHSGIAFVTLQHRQAGAPWSTGKELSIASGSAVIPGEDVRAEGIDYRIMATDNVGNSDTLANGSLDFFSVQILVVEDIAAARIMTSAGTQVTDFGMVSVPLILRDDEASIVFSAAGTYGQDWRLWTFDGGLSDAGWRQQSAANDIQIVAGKAYFLLTRNSATINNGEGFTISLSDVAKENVPTGWNLKSGWNFVGNPFLTDIALSGLGLESGETLSSQNVFYFSGQTASGWTNASGSLTLRAKEGLAMRVSGDTKLLLTSTEGLSKQGFHKMVTDLDPFGEIPQPDEWLLRITASSEAVSDDLNYLGVKTNASVDFDQYDWYEPPTLPGGIAVYFKHDDWEQQGAYTSDIRPVTEDGYVWQTTVSAEPGAFVNLRLDAVATLPEEFQVYVIVPDNKMVHNVRLQPTFELSTPVGSRDFKVLVGTSDFVRSNSEGLVLVPISFALHQNYPNPFNPSTTIRYELPVQARVALKIYTLIGREVATLVDAEQSAGYYEARWDVTDPTGGSASEVSRGSGYASGVYIYRLTAESSESTLFHEVRKMILVK